VLRAQPVLIGSRYRLRLVPLCGSGADKTIRIWNTATAQCEFVLAGAHSTGICDISWSSDSKYLASGADDKNVVLWDIANVRAVSLCQHHIDDSVLSSCVSSWL